MSKQPTSVEMIDRGDQRFLLKTYAEGISRSLQTMTGRNLCRFGSMTDQQRADLHRPMSAYGGTYTFDGKKVEHHVDFASNEVWNGTTVVRDVAADGDRLIYTTRPAPFANDGKVSVVTVVWEKVN